MNAAAIGLIGVVVGALLAGTFNLVLDRRARLAKAKIAGRLIGVELNTAEEKIASAIQASKTGSNAAGGGGSPAGQPPPVNSAGWWMGDLPMDAWKRHQSDLAIDVRPEVLEIVARAYALCAVLNDEHAEARESEARPQGDLDEYGQAITQARQQLVDASKIRDRKTPQRLARWSPALVVTAFVLVLAILALLAPRVDVNSASVTSAVESRLGSGMLVQCNPGSGDWACTAYPPSWSASSCSTEAAAFFLQPRRAAHAPAALVPAPSTCTGTVQPIAFTADVDGGDVLAAVVEQAGHADKIKELAGSLATSSALQRFWRSIFG